MGRGLIAAAALLLAGAAAAQAPGARGFLVYFPWNSAALTPEGAGLAREFADFYRPEEISRIVVIGHADTSGEEDYNRGLSLERARTVAAELERLGIERRIISTEGRGEREPLVDTGDGVPEQRNRRAEIVYLR